VFYFFQRGSEFVRCELSGTADAGFTIVVTEPDGDERVESFRSSEDAHERWVELPAMLVNDGWWGPHGRD
jgi:hypothetical protein